MTEPRVVVGASHAGVELALKLRQLDASRSVLRLGDEPMPPYHRLAQRYTVAGRSRGSVYGTVWPPRA